MNSIIQNRQQLNTDFLSRSKIYNSGTSLSINWNAASDERMGVEKMLSYDDWGR